MLRIISFESFKISSDCLNLLWADSRYRLISAEEVRGDESLLCTKPVCENLQCQSRFVCSSIRVEMFKLRSLWESKEVDESERVKLGELRSSSTLLGFGELVGVIRVGKPNAPGGVAAAAGRDDDVAMTSFQHV